MDDNRRLIPFLKNGLTADIWGLHAFLETPYGGIVLELPHWREWHGIYDIGLRTRVAFRSHRSAEEY